MDLLCFSKKYSRRKKKIQDNQQTLATKPADHLMLPPSLKGVLYQVSHGIEKIMLPSPKTMGRQSKAHACACNRITVGYSN